MEKALHLDNGSFDSERNEVKRPNERGRSDRILGDPCYDPTHREQTANSVTSYISYTVHARQ
jgi:hypothetical protein